MPLEFPNSPANGEYANGFIWNAANQTWDSAIAPRAATIPISSPNYIINGGFDIWQRGTSGTPSSASNTFVADRWQTYRLGYAAGLTASRQPAGLDGFQYALRLQRTAGNTATDAVFLNQSLETIESVKLAGKTITFSFYARVGSTFSAPSSTITARIHTGTGTDENVRTGFTGGAVIKTENKIVSTSWQRFSITATLGSSITEVAVAFLYEPSGTAGANDYLEITGVQLEEGAAATDFRRNAPSIQGELAACQRYYQQTYPLGTVAGTPTNAGALMQFVPVTGNSIRLPIQLGTRMRVAPTANLYGAGTGAANVWQYEGAGTTSQFTASTTFGAEGGFLIYATAATVANSNVYIHYTANAEL